MPCDSVLHLTCAMHFAALPSMRRRKRFQESQQAKQVTFMMPAYDDVKTDRPGFASYGSDIGDMACRTLLYQTDHPLSTDAGAVQHGQNCPECCHAGNRQRI